MIELKNKRIDRGLTQKQIADSLGVKQNTVSQWESGERQPSVGLLPKLAELLDCTVDELLGIEKTPANDRV